MTIAWLFIRANWKAFALAGVALAVVLGVLGYGAHERHMQRVADAAATQQALAEAAARNQAALARAETDRAKDTAATVALEKDLTHAYAATPDSKPSAARLALACRRLRNASPGAKLPVACGPQG